jgi:hypothetical protein
MSWEGLNLVCDLNSVSDDLNCVLLGGQTLFNRFWCLDDLNRVLPDW